MLVYLLFMVKHLDNSAAFPRLEDDGEWLVELIYDGDLFDILHKVGNIPLPPYIERKLKTEEIKQFDMERYQTVYAKDEGSVAAPTAGLHFTEEILQKLKDKGVEIAYVTLNVGLGTFRPVKCDNVLDHKMHSETYEITKMLYSAAGASDACALVTGPEGHRFYADLAWPVAKSLLK